MEDLLDKKTINQNPTDNLTTFKEICIETLSCTVKHYRESNKCSVVEC